MTFHLNAGWEGFSPAHFCDGLKSCLQILYTLPINRLSFILFSLNMGWP